jgi:hypothetical protein
MKSCAVVVLSRSLLALVVLLVANCEERSLATESDIRAADQVNSKWLGALEISLESDTFVLARPTKGSEIPLETAKAVFEEFFGRTGKDISFAQINYYDSKGKFVFQLYRDRNGEIKISEAERY